MIEYSKNRKYINLDNAKYSDPNLKIKQELLEKLTQEYNRQIDEWIDKKILSLLTGKDYWKYIYLKKEKDLPALVEFFIEHGLRIVTQRQNQIYKFYNVDASVMYYYLYKHEKLVGTLYYRFDLNGSKVESWL